jgi:hypothetical protein
MSVISWQDIQLRVRRTFAADDIAFVTDAIADYESEASTIFGRPIEPDTFTEDYTLVQGQADVFFRATPVIDVESVVVNPGTPGQVTADPASYRTFKWGISFLDPSWSLVFAATHNLEVTAVEGTKLLITYTAGIDATALGAVRRVLKTAVGREWLARDNDAQNVSNLHAGRMMDYTFTDGNAGGFTEDERKAISRYRRRRVV